MDIGCGAGVVLTAAAPVVDQAGTSAGALALLEAHGGNLEAMAQRLGCRPSQLLDASASLVPFGLPWSARWALARADWRTYPDRSSQHLRVLLAGLHQLDPAMVLPGNGAAELFTWAARDAAAGGLSLLPQPGFADYGRALRSWGGAVRPVALPLQWEDAFPQPLPELGSGDVLWITNPHNPTGQLWSRASLEPLLDRYRLVICDEAFLPLVPGGERQSLIPLVAEHSNLVVIRSLTKLYGIAGVRLGYAVAGPERLSRWSRWRDPWPINAAATALAGALLEKPQAYQRWCRRVQRWCRVEARWMATQLEALPVLTPLPTSANYLLVRAEQSLLPLRERLEQRHRVLLRDCRSFEGLGERWLRIGLQSRAGNRRILRALRAELL
jgi:histidinol-phosphate/aromatic aminotransferase/cobyric acid decarboxylase-like protein